MKFDVFEFLILNVFLNDECLSNVKCEKIQYFILLLVKKGNLYDFFVFLQTVP